jgi:LysM repeat protein
MKSAKDYKVTFGYKATDGYYYGKNGKIGPYHRGNDRAMPIGTPVKVNGVTISRSGTTGASSGPHLHTGLWVGGSDKNPTGKEWNITGAKVYDTGYDSMNGNYVRVIGKDGGIRVYLHNSKILVKAGQKLVIPKVSKPKYYIVKSGDYLNKIAGMFKTTVAKIMKLNPKVKNPNYIKVKDKLRVK